MEAGTPVRLRVERADCPAPGSVVRAADVHTYDTSKRLTQARDVDSTIYVRWTNGSIRKHNVAELEVVTP